MKSFITLDLAVISWNQNYRQQMQKQTNGTPPKLKTSLQQENNQWSETAINGMGEKIVKHISNKGLIFRL